MLVPLLCHYYLNFTLIFIHSGILSMNFHNVSLGPHQGIFIHMLLIVNMATFQCHSNYELNPQSFKYIPQQSFCNIANFFMIQIGFEIMEGVQGQEKGFGIFFVSLFFWNYFPIILSEAKLINEKILCTITWEIWRPSGFSPTSK